jgi:Multisubunit Na+/H+ antiporter, MnhE subunit
MRLFFGNILLALLFMLLMDAVSLTGLMFGFLFGFLALWFAKPVMAAKTTYFSTIFRVIRLVIFFIQELVISSVRVAWDVITPTDLSRPKVIRMPLDVESELEVFLVANLISLTPGTLTLDVDEVNRQLIIHAMFADDEDALIKELKDGMEYQVKHVFEGIS